MRNDDSHTLAPGTVLGEYRLVRWVGGGNFGDVYEAQSVRAGHVVALKVISLRNRQQVAAEELGAHLQQQFALASDFAPAVFDIGRHGDSFAVAMEFVNAPTLAGLLDGGPLAPRDAARYAMSICEFLEKAAVFPATIDGQPRTGFAHGDLKPAHVFITTTGIKVIDFGIAKSFSTATPETTQIWATPHYSSPERLDNGRASARDDLWALGVMLYEMLAGHRPYPDLESQSDNGAALRSAILTGVRPEPLGDCPPGLNAIVEKTMRWQAEKRYPSAAALRQDLEQFRRGKDPQALLERRAPATVVVASGGAFRSTPRPVPPTVPQPSPGDPQPAAVSAAASTVGSSGRGLSAVSPVASRRAMFVRQPILRSLVLASLIFFATEALAWMRAEWMRADLGAMEVGSVASRHQDYESLRRWSLLHLGVSLRLDHPLKARLIELGDAVIEDFRQEIPAVREVQWGQAREAFEWAAELAPRDASLAFKRTLCNAHLRRIDTKSWVKNNPKLAKAAPDEVRKRYQAAVQMFDKAANQNTSSPDPYLGLIQIYFVGLKDSSAGAAALDEAKRRRYTPSRRDLAFIADAYFEKAQADMRELRDVDEEDRRSRLLGLRDEYQHCADAYATILDFGNARERRGVCQRRLDAINRLLDQDATDKP